MKISKEQEGNDLKQKHNIKINAMEIQKAQVADEIEEIKSSNKELQEKLITAKTAEKQLEHKTETINKESTPNLPKFLNEPTKFV